MAENLPVKNQNFSPTNLEQAERFAALVAKTDFAPKEYRGNPGNILVAMVFGSELGLAPMQSLQNIAVINGKPSIYGDTALALVLSHQTCEYVQESFENVTETAVCRCKRKGQQEYVEKFSKKDAQTAGLWGKGGPWTNYPRRMLTMRARGFALRNIWPDVLKGIITREEAQDYPAPSKMETVVEAEYKLKEEMAINANQPAEPEPTPRDNTAFVKKYLDTIAEYDQASKLAAWWALAYKGIKSELGDDPNGRGGGDDYKKLYAAMLARKEALAPVPTITPKPEPEQPVLAAPLAESDAPLRENEVVCPQDGTIKHKENDCIRGACDGINNCTAWE